MTPEEDSISRPADDSVSGRNDTDEGNFSVGTIVRVDGDTFAILEYNFADDAFVEQTYQVEPATEYGNIRCLADLREADSVVIDYRLDGDSRVVEYLLKQDPEPDDPPDDHLPVDQ